MTTARNTQGAFNDIEIIDEPSFVSIRDLMAYWQGKCAGRVMPRRADIDPVDIPSHLRDVFLLDVLDGGKDFRYRLIGTRIVAGMGRDATGRRITELYRRQPEAATALVQLFGKGVAEKRPVFVRGRIFWLPTRDVRLFEAGYLPLSEDGVTVNMVLAEFLVVRPDGHR
jgi:hypothetical protein